MIFVILGIVIDILLIVFLTLFTSHYQARLIKKIRTQSLSGLDWGVLLATPSVMMALMLGYVMLGAMSEPSLMVMVLFLMYLTCVYFSVLQVRTGMLLPRWLGFLNMMICWGLPVFLFVPGGLSFSHTPKNRVMVLLLLLIWTSIIWGPLLYYSHQWKRDRLQRERRSARHCHACGYDLRGSIEATHCPECGQARLLGAKGDAS